MKKLLTIMLILILSLVLISQQTFAAIGTISVINNYNKSSSTLTTYVKNSDNKSSQSVKLELQKNNKTISSTTVSVKKSTQVKKAFKLSSKGKYRIKYTVNGKFSYTNSYNY